MPNMDGKVQVYPWTCVNINTSLSEMIAVFTHTTLNNARYARRSQKPSMSCSSQLFEKVELCNCCSAYRAKQHSRQLAPNILLVSQPVG